MTKKLSIIIAAICLTISPLAGFAEDGNKVTVNGFAESGVGGIGIQTQGGSGLAKYLESVVNATVKTVASMVYEFNPSYPTTVALNTQQPKVVGSVSTQTQQLTQCEIENSLPQPSSDTSALRNISSICNQGKFNVVKSLSQLAAIPGTDTVYVPSNIFPIFSQKQSLDLATGDKNFNFNTLLSSEIYDDATYAQAINFLNYTGQLYDQLPVPPTQGMSQKQKIQLQNNPVYQKNQVDIRAFIAARSVALNNLFKIIAERTAQDNIISLNLKDQAGQAIQSAAQYQHYLATRRVNNPKWYDQMSQASPSTIARESLFVLAEIQHQLYQLHQDNIRLISTVSVIQLQGQQFNKSNLQLNAQNVQNVVKQQGQAKQQQQMKEIEQNLKEKAKESGASQSDINKLDFQTK